MSEVIDYSKLAQRVVELTLLELSPFSQDVDRFQQEINQLELDHLDKSEIIALKKEVHLRIRSRRNEVPWWTRCEPLYKTAYNIINARIA